MGIAAPIEMRFERGHGIHHFETVDGMPVTALSLPSWEEFADELQALDETTGYIVSPELITSPVMLHEISSMRTVIENRAAAVQEASVKHPWGRILLGTATFEYETIYNSVVAYCTGQKVGQQHKIEIAAPEEARIFDDGTSLPKTALNRPAEGLLICSDLWMAAATASVPEAHNKFRQRYIASGVRTLLVPSCWGVPYEHHTNDIVPETRYMSTLMRSAQWLLGACVELEEIIVVDRAIPETGLQPYNAHFKRR